ncbi:MAG: hypothetical protein WBC91_21410 [Phototrophicaceae bacterium]
MRKFLIVLLTLLSLGLGIVVAQEPAPNNIDFVRPDAPALAAQGDFDIGVQTLELVNPDQVDILNTQPDGETVFYDRPLTVEVWYPAATDGAAPTPYIVGTRDVDIDATLLGRAVRDAAPDMSAGPYPLIIISHGYPGNRFLMAHLAESLATKGYVVVSIDHTDSTYVDQNAFGSTLLNRSLDQLFVLNTMAEMGSSDSDNFLAGLVDADNTGIIGYSMGGYGVVNVVGGGYTEASVAFGFGPPNGLLAARQSGTEEYEATFDDRIKAVIAVAPWGMNVGFWDAEGLAGIETPIFFMAGSVDDVSGYEIGTRAIYDLAVNADRYLLTFENGNHNSGAAMPVPNELLAADSPFYTHYVDAVWDTARMNNIAQHFATAFFGVYIKGDETLNEYLDVPVENSIDGVYAVDDAGEFTDEHTYWAGFPARSAVGLRLEHSTPQE